MALPDVSVTWVISGSATVLLLTYFWFSRRNPKLPPFPLRAWPIVGNLLQLDPDPREQFARFRKQCGDIFSLYLGPNHVVVLNGLDVVKEAYIKRGDDFSDKATIFMDIALNAVNKGIVSSNGDIWKEHRSFSISVLRNFGLRKNILAGKIQEEVDHLIELLEGFKGEARDIHTFTEVSLRNIICSILIGQRYEYDNEEFKRIGEIIIFNLSKLKGTMILNYFPWLRFLPGDLFFCKMITKNFSEFYDIFARVHINENDNVVGEPGNFIAAYLQQMKVQELAGEKTYLDKPNLLRTIFDLFVAGSDTIAYTLEWFFLYMLNYPDVQEAIFQEIVDVVGVERVPGTQDTSKLIYLTASIMEVQRMVNLLPLSFPRVVTRDVSFRGYLIPKGTTILVNFASILHDPSVWGDDADTFRPERFIAKDRRLISHEAWVPFSLGRRVCIGESMARMEMFLFVSNILQRFQILPADPKAIPPIKGSFWLNHVPQHYEMRLVHRVSHDQGT